MSYFDTSHLLKCHVKEHGWEAVRAFACRRQRISSVYGCMELLAALHRKLREGDLTRPQLSVVLRQLDVDESEKHWDWIPLSSAIIDAVCGDIRESARRGAPANRRPRPAGPPETALIPVPASRSSPARRAKAQMASLPRRGEGAGMPEVGIYA